MNQLNHQESVTSNIQQFTSNPRPIIPKPVLWFWISWGDLIIIPLIIVTLGFNLKSIHLNLSLTMFQIQKSPQ